MLKKYSTVFLLVVLSVAVAFAGKFDEQRAYRVTPEDMAKWDAMLDKATILPAGLPTEAVVEVGRSYYDYAANNIHGRQHNHSAMGIHFAFMKRIDTPDPYAAGTRYVNYDYYDNTLGIMFGNAAPTTAASTGWGRVLNGVNDEALISMHGGGLRFFQDASEAGYNFSPMQFIAGTGVFPGMARLGNTLVFIGQLANGSWLLGDTILVSTDYGTNWVGRNVWEMPAPTADYGTGEMWPTINPTNPTEFSIPYCPDVTTLYPAGSTWIATTPDLGVTWNHTLVWDDNGVFGPTNSQYIIENFGQFNSMYTQDGVFHLVMGAIQGVADTATSTAIDMFPILYWNTREQVLVELTDPYYGRPQNPLRSRLTANRPGNGLGNAYPILSEGPNTGELVCIWQQWEDDGTGAPVLITPVPPLPAPYPQGSGIDIFATDIWGSYSNDGGMTWSTPFFVTGTAGESDVYPFLPDKFMWNATQDSIILDVMYLFDSVPSVSFNNFGTWSSPNEAIWVYERVAIASGPTGIGVEPNVVNEYRLSQNYPNPFNPTTTIAFQLKNAGDVSIAVFNTLGQKVATVVNEKMAAGSHTVNFDASNLASGVYIYRLTSGEVSLTKKMMLLK